MTRANGFTLVELLVALALFGMIAWAATALAGSASRSFAASETALASVTNIDRARALLAADLGQAAARPSLAADGRPMPAFVLTADGFVMVRRGVDGVLPSIQKIAWGFDGKGLLRQGFPAIDGVEPGPATLVVPGLKAIRVRVNDGSGWRDQWRPEKPEMLPRAVELTLQRKDGLTVTMKMLVAT